MTDLELLAVASERPRRLTSIGFCYLLDGNNLHRDEQRAIEELVRSGLLRVERSVHFHRTEWPVVPTPAGEATLVTAPYAEQPGGDV